jgi:SAM-dependent methyltransferase
MKELREAPPGSYDDRLEWDIEQPLRSLCARFDLIVSWQALEHLANLRAAIVNCLHYLVPGGHFIAHLSGRYSPFSMLNMILPSALTRRILIARFDRPDHNIHRAHYDRCFYDELCQQFRQGWSQYEVLPRFGGAAMYLRRSALEDWVRAYETWAMRHRLWNLASHYLVDGIS